MSNEKDSIALNKEAGVFHKLLCQELKLRGLKSLPVCTLRGYIEENKAKILDENSL